jgi:hypothetical protein
MDLTKWYAVALGGLVALLFLSHRISLMTRIALSYAASCLLKRKYHPQIHRYVRGPERATLFDVGLVVAFVVGNVICLTLEVKDVAGLVKRSGVICTINLVPLALGGHMNMVASWCGLSLGAFARIHEWLGIVALVEGLVHTVAGAASQKIDLHATSGIATLTVSRLGFLTSERQLTRCLPRLALLQGPCCSLQSLGYVDTYMRSFRSFT